MKRPNKGSFLRWAFGGLGFAFGAYFVNTSPYVGAPLWPVWAPLLVGSTIAAGLVFSYGLNRWAELLTYSKVRVRDSITGVAIVWGGIELLLIGVLVLSWTRVITPGVSWRHVALISVLVIGSVPAALVIGGIQNVAGEESRAGEAGERAALLIRLRDLLQRLLAALGSVVALSTLAIGASIRLEHGLMAHLGQGSAKPLPPQFVLVFGGLGSTLVALCYIPAATALQRRGLCLSSELFPIKGLKQGPDVLSAFDNRHKLEQLLGVDRNIVTDLQNGLAILGPILVSAVAAFLAP